MALTGYSAELNVQILVGLLRAHGIKYVVASPGTTNGTFVASLQRDPHFVMFSNVDERSAGYMACGLAHETGSPVVLSCTGATASRNYLPSMTEAYYRRLPVLAITSTQNLSRVGHLVPQVIDRSIQPRDTYRASLELPVVTDDESRWDCEFKINSAILELTGSGGGPVHLNLPTTYSRDFGVKTLPPVRKIERVGVADQLPDLWGRIAVFIGSHREFTAVLIEELERFCDKFGAVVLADHTSGYRGRHRLRNTLLGSQDEMALRSLRPDITIHLGEVSGDYSATPFIGQEVWRVSADGELRDTFRRLRYQFDMPEEVFLRRYSDLGTSPRVDAGYQAEFRSMEKLLVADMPDLPFSNIWIASVMAPTLPEDSAIHFGILNSLRSWNFFDLPSTVRSSANVGGFGIDGNLSSLLGASLADPSKLYFGIVGDLAFFYDLNSLGNRHLGRNLRILLVNNGTGTEFGLYNHPLAHFGESADAFLAGTGHFGKMSRGLVKDFAENLGLAYLTACNKGELLGHLKAFVDPKLSRSMVLEVFTDGEEESRALRMMRSIRQDASGRNRAAVRRWVGPSAVRRIKKILRRH